MVGFTATIVAVARMDAKTERQREGDNHWPGCNTPVTLRSRALANRRCYAASFDRDEGAGFMSEPYLPRPRNLLLGVHQHLLPLRQPTGGSRNRKEHREHLGPESHRLVDNSGIEIYVRIELAANEVVVHERYTFQFERDLDFCIATRDFKKIVRCPLDDLRARIVILVDPMAE